MISTVVLEKTLESPLDCQIKPVNPKGILKEYPVNPEYSLEGLTLKLKLQYFGHLMRRADSFEKTLVLRGIGGKEEKGMTGDETVGWNHRVNGQEFG